MRGRKNAMSRARENEPESTEESPTILPADIPRGAIYSYYRDDMENAGGLKVKWTIRVVTGPDAAPVDARQADAIREALTWAQRHHKLPPPPAG
jgi:hypothetical protein